MEKQRFTEEKASARQCPPVSDIYFYLELLESVGPEASNDWLQTSSIEKSKRFRCPVAVSPPISPAATQRRSPHPKPILIHNNSTLFKDNESNSSSLSYPESPDQVHCRIVPEASPAQNSHTHTASMQSGISTLTALDIELSMGPTCNVGLLFTDAAHIFLHDCELQSALRRRKSSVF
jgi:hypothetical protein